MGAKSKKSSLPFFRGLTSRHVGERSQYVVGGHLDAAAVADRFSAFMQSEYRDEDGAFIESHARLLFLSFLKPIINGAGHYAVEPETRGNRRMDVVVFYGQEEFIFELKIHSGTHEIEDFGALYKVFLRISCRDSRSTIMARGRESAGGLTNWRAI
jgi:hypothetical protein